jgi:hypothetical protein
MKENESASNSPANGVDANSAANTADMALLKFFLTERDTKAITSATNLTQSTAYRRLLALVERGAIGRQGNLYKTSSLGTRLLNGDDSPVAPERILKEKLPALNLVPSNLHRSVLLLMIFAFIARRDHLTNDAHPAFILLGPTQRLKSWLVRVLCYLVGVDPDNARLSMGQVRRRGLLARLGNKGEVIYENQALQELIIWCEELSLAEAEVARDVETLIEGRDVVRIENQTLNVNGVVVFELNPRKEDGTLEKRIGLRAQRLRRCCVVDFTAPRLTPKVRARSAQTLEEIKALKPLDLPSAPHEVVSPQTAELVVEALDLCTLDSHGDYVDVTRVLTLIAGAKALLDERSAAATVLFGYFALTESCGHTTPSWRVDLAELLYPAPATPPAPNPPSAVPVSCAPIELAKEKPMMTARPNPFLLDQNLLALKATLDALLMPTPESIEYVEKVLRFHLCPTEMANLLVHFSTEFIDGQRIICRNAMPTTVALDTVKRALVLYKRCGDLGISSEQAEEILQRFVQTQR